MAVILILVLTAWHHKTDLLEKGRDILWSLNMDLWWINENIQFLYLPVLDLQFVKQSTVTVVLEDGVIAVVRPKKGFTTKK